MSRKTSSIMKIMGTTFAVCSAAAMLGSTMSGTSSMKKAVKKTANKVVGIVDTISSIM